MCRAYGNNKMIHILSFKTASSLHPTTRERGHAVFVFKSKRNEPQAKLVPLFPFLFFLQVRHRQVRSRLYHDTPLDFKVSD